MQDSFTFFCRVRRVTYIHQAGAETAKPATPPPPPSRAQTTSPSASSFNSSGHPGSMKGNTPPPPRPMSALEPGMPPPQKSLLRVRSNLVPDPSSESAPPTPGTPSVMSGISAAPPTGRSKSAAKRNARSRYVDVFQAEGS